MRTTSLTITLLAGAALAACHHRREPDTTIVPTTTTTTTTTTSTDDAMASPSTSTTTTSSTMASTNAPRRSEGGGGGAGAERREVRLGIRSLVRAKYELEHATHDYGGRRADAIKAVDDALRELRLANGQEVREARTGSEAPRERKAEEHELQRALSDLERARGDMEHATHDFSGRRKETLAAVDAAIREVRAAAQNEK